MLYPFELRARFVLSIEITAVRVQRQSFDLSF